MGAHTGDKRKRQHKPGRHLDRRARLYRVASKYGRIPTGRALSPQARRRSRQTASPRQSRNDPLRKQVTASQQTSKKQASGSGPLVSVPRYRPVVKQAHQAAGAASTPRQAAHRLRRLRPARVGKAGPRPSQAPSGPRRPQPSLAPSQASGVDPAPAAWSEGLTTGRYRGTDTSPGQVLSEILRYAQYSASIQALGGSPKIRR